MYNSKKYIIGIIIALTLVAIGTYFVWKDLNKNLNEDLGSQDIATSTDKTATSTGEITITPVPVGRPAPSLPFPPEIKADLSADSKVVAISAIKEIVAQLRKDPTQYGYWIDYGLQMNFIGDYDRAREAWEYASYLRPNDFIPLHNLGDLYTYSIPNYAKAESYYRKSITADPTATMVYQKLHELYRFRIKDNVKAKAILEEGIAKNPTTGDWLKKLLAEFEKEVAI